MTDEKEVQAWPPDNPLAKDPVERVNLERAKVDTAYFEANREEVSRALRTLESRKAAAQEAARLERVNEETRARFEAAEEERRTAENRRYEALTAALQKERESVTERLAGNTKRW